MSTIGHYQLSCCFYTLRNQVESVKEIQSELLPIHRLRLMVIPLLHTLPSHRSGGSSVFPLRSPRQWGVGMGELGGPEGQSPVLWVQPCVPRVCCFLLSLLEVLLSHRTLHFYCLLNV